MDLELEGKVVCRVCSSRGSKGFPKGDIGNLLLARAKAKAVVILIRHLFVVRSSYIKMHINTQGFGA